ncbi:MAG TPA: S8 family serine peptidase [Solirubrobacter sp.]|nr:S8 family serine peptidase [Solirubrobacter sp.]
MSELPQSWDPRQVALNRDEKNQFLLRPGQILAGPGDAADVQKVLPDWKPSDRRPFGVTQFVTTPKDPKDPAREIHDALARIRKATSERPQGPARVAPNHVLVGEGITLTGEPRIQGGPGSSVRVAKPPRQLPHRTKRADDGKGVKIAVLDTGLFEHPWLAAVQQAPNAADTWDADHDDYADAEAGHGTFIAGLILQVAPAATVHVVKVLDSHGLGDDLTVARAIEQLPPDVDIINLSLGGYTDDDAAPLAIATALNALRSQRKAIVAAAGNANRTRPFWPAAFKQVLGVGATEQKDGQWRRAGFSNHGWWVDATARGVDLQSTFTKGKTKAATGDHPDPADPWIAFAGWAAWDGTSFASPIAAALIARAMTRSHIHSAADAQAHLQSTAPPAPQPDFPLAVNLDELTP